MNQVNITEKEIAKKFQIPYKCLVRARKNGLFNLNICFTPPFSHKILYNVGHFSIWFDANKGEALLTKNQLIRKAVANLNLRAKQLEKQGRKLGFIPDGRKRKK